MLTYARTDLSKMVYILSDNSFASGSTFLPQHSTSCKLGNPLKFRTVMPAGTKNRLLQLRLMQNKISTAFSCRKSIERPYCYRKHWPFAALSYATQDLCERKAPCERSLSVEHVSSIATASTGLQARNVTMAKTRNSFAPVYTHATPYRKVKYTQI